MNSEHFSNDLSSSDMQEQAIYTMLLRTVMDGSDSEYTQRAYLETETVMGYLRETGRWDIQAFLNEYTSEDTTALLGYALVTNQFAMLYCGDDDEKFKVYGRPRSMDDFVLLCADVFSGFLNDNGFDDASRWFDAFMGLSL